MKLIHTFRATRQGTIVYADRERREITWIPDGGEQATEWTQDDRSIDWSSLTLGTRLRVQDGPMTRMSSDSRGGRRRYIYGNNGGHAEFTIHTGKSCIDHIAHPAPRVSRLAMRLMQYAMGSATAVRHLRDWARHASTRQTAIEADLGGGRRITLHLETGLLQCTLRLSPDVLVERSLVRTGLKGLPTSILAAMSGRAVGEIVGHPALMDADLVVSEAQLNAFNRLEIRPDADDVMSAADAAALIERESALAA